VGRIEDATEHLTRKSTFDLSHQKETRGFLLHHIQPLYIPPSLLLLRTPLLTTSPSPRGEGSWGNDRYGAASQHPLSVGDVADHRQKEWREGSLYG
jgi:hypothetical protein